MDLGDIKNLNEFSIVCEFSDNEFLNNQANAQKYFEDNLSISQVKTTVCSLENCLEFSPDYTTDFLIIIATVVSIMSFIFVIMRRVTSPYRLELISVSSCPYCNHQLKGQAESCPQCNVKLGWEVGK